MPLNYQLTQDAKLDLIEIRKYTKSRWGSDQTKKYTAALREAISLLAENPELGKSRQEVGKHVFSFPYGSHVIYYLKKKHNIVIFAVLHKRMVPQNHLAHRKN